MTLTEFLLARIAEDEYAAALTYETCFVGTIEGRGSRYDLAVRFSPARVVAECEAKLRTVEEHPRCDTHDRPGLECDACQTCGDGSIWPCPTLLYAAAVYADHLDYREEWRP